VLLAGGKRSAFASGEATEVWNRNDAIAALALSWDHVKQQGRHSAAATQTVTTLRPDGRAHEFALTGILTGERVAMEEPD
jgi:hypothetical protein